MVVIKFINENGKVAAKVRAQAKAQALTKVRGALAGIGVEDNADGGFSIALAEDARTGKTVYAHFTCVVSDRDPSEQTSKTKTKSKTKKVADEVMPDLFAEDED